MTRDEKKRADDNKVNKPDTKKGRKGPSKNPRESETMTGKTRKIYRDSGKVDKFDKEKADRKKAAKKQQIAYASSSNETSAEPSAPVEAPKEAGAWSEERSTSSGFTYRYDSARARVEIIGLSPGDWEARENAEEDIAKSLSKNIDELGFSLGVSATTPKSHPLSVQEEMRQYLVEDPEVYLEQLEDYVATNLCTLPVQHPEVLNFSPVFKSAYREARSDGLKAEQAYLQAMEIEQMTPSLEFSPKRPFTLPRCPVVFYMELDHYLLPQISSEPMNRVEEIARQVTILEDIWKAQNPQKPSLQEAVEIVKIDPVNREAQRVSKLFSALQNISVHDQVQAMPEAIRDPLMKVALANLREEELARSDTMRESFMEQKSAMSDALVAISSPHVTEEERSRSLKLLRSLKSLSKLHACLEQLDSDVETGSALGAEAPVPSNVSSDILDVENGVVTTDITFSKRMWCSESHRIATMSSPTPLHGGSTLLRTLREIICGLPYSLLMIFLVALFLSAYGTHLIRMISQDLSNVIASLEEMRYEVCAELQNPPVIITVPHPFRSSIYLRPVPMMMKILTLVSLAMCGVLGVDSLERFRTWEYQSLKEKAFSLVSFLATVTTFLCTLGFISMTFEAYVRILPDYYVIHPWTWYVGVKNWLLGDSCVSEPLSALPIYTWLGYEPHHIMTIPVLGPRLYKFLSRSLTLEEIGRWQLSGIRLVVWGSRLTSGTAAIWILQRLAMVTSVVTRVRVPEMILSKVKRTKGNRSLDAKKTSEELGGSRCVVEVRRTAYILGLAIPWGTVKVEVYVDLLASLVSASSSRVGFSLKKQLELVRESRHFALSLAADRGALKECVHGSYMVAEAITEGRFFEDDQKRSDLGLARLPLE